MFNWTGKNDYVALCEPESISFGGGCVLSPVLTATATPLPSYFDCLNSLIGMGITASTSTKRSTKGRPLVARRSTTTLSALRTRAMVAVTVTPLRLNASVWRSGALGYDIDVSRANALYGNVLGYFADIISQA